MLFTFAFGEDSERARAAVRDEDILAVARNGPDALRRLYEKTSKGVYAYALSLLKNAHDAEDVCQETFLSIYDKAGDYEPQGKPMAWIITVAKRHALTVLRKERGKSYIEEAEKEGVRSEVAFAQTMKETGWLQYGGDAKITQFNFAGLGTTGNGVQGNSFSDVREGVRAQIQHLKAYATDEKLLSECVDSRYSYVTKGCAPYVEWLGQQENPEGYGWATGENYGYDIVKMINTMKNI